MDENYEYNAPQYVDFEASLCEKEEASADAYFDQDHENPLIKTKMEDEFKMAENVPKTDIPLDIETETGDVSQTKAAVKRKSRNCGNVRRSWEDRKEVQGEVPASSARVPTMEMLKEAALRQRTPERKALRQAVAKTIESVSNSPKLLLTKRLPRPGKGGSLVLSLKAGSSSRRLSAGGSTTSKKEGSSATRSMLRKNPAAVGSGRARGPLKATSGLVKTAETQEILKVKVPPRRKRRRRIKNMCVIC